MSDDTQFDAPKRSRTKLQGSLQETAVDETPAPTEKPTKPPVEGESQEYKLVVTVVEYYQDQEQAETEYRLFAGGGDNHVVLKQGNKVISEKGWGSKTDKYGHHAIDGRLHKIFYRNE